MISQLEDLRENCGMGPFQATREGSEFILKILAVVDFAIKMDKNWWFDPSNERSACAFCDANLLGEGRDGVHIGADGSPCQMNQLHEILENLEK